MRKTLAPASLLLTLALAAHAQSPGTGINLNHATPAAPIGARNVTFQNDSSAPTRNVSAYVTYPTIQVACPASGDLSGPVNNAQTAVSGTYGGIIDARACTAATTWTNAVTISQANTAILLPCVTLTASQTLTVYPDTRNVTIHGCAYMGGSNAGGTVGGTVWNYTGSGNAFTVGDNTQSTDTRGFALTDIALTLPSAGTNAIALALYRAQDIDLERVYFIGNNAIGQIGIFLQGQGNYSGGTFINNTVSDFGTALQLQGTATGGGNASTFVRLHIDCPTSAGAPIAGSIGVQLLWADGNTFTGGDWESCDTMLYLGPNATSNTFTGVRNENSNTQVYAASGSNYNLWLAGGTFFTGKITDLGTHNSFVDTFHRSWNNLNGDLWRSQADTTVTNHVITGIGLGNVRGLQQEWTTDTPGSPANYQNAWLWGPGDGTSGTQAWVLEDLLNTTNRIGFDQTTSGAGNNQSYINSTGTAAVIFNGSTHSGTGGTVFGSGGATPTQVANIDASGNLATQGYHALYNGPTLEWYTGLSSGTTFEIHNAAATTPANVFRAFPNAGTEVDSQGTSAVTINNTSTGGTGGLIVYEGGSNSSVAAFSVSGTGATSQTSNSQIGSASGTGNAAIGNHLNQLGTADFAGTCAMSTSTTCHFGFQHSYTAAVCFASDENTSPATFALGAYYSAGDCYITAAVANSDTWGCICIGNPN